MTLAKLPHFSVTWISWEHCHYEHFGDLFNQAKIAKQNTWKSCTEWFMV